MVLLEWTKCFMLICLLTRLGGIPYAFFMRIAYYCGLLETISPLFNTLADKCQIIKGVLMVERKVRRWQWKIGLLPLWSVPLLKYEILYHEWFLLYRLKNHHSVTKMSHSVNSW